MSLAFVRSSEDVLLVDQRARPPAVVSALICGELGQTDEGKYILSGLHKGLQ